MKLYHGTTSLRLNSILENGLTPRGNNGTNWADRPSRPDLVYLTSAFPLFYGQHAVDDMDQEKILMIEIDTDLLDQSKFLPDEDFVCQRMARNLRMKIERTSDAKEKVKLKQKIKDVGPKVWNNLEAYRSEWRDSLNGIGTVTYKESIPPSAITRYCLFDMASQPSITMTTAKSYVGLQGFRATGTVLQQFVAWAFGDRQIWPDVIRHSGQFDIEILKQLETNRSGIEVVSLDVVSLQHAG